MDYKNGDTITLEHPNGSRIVATIRDDVITVGGLSFFIGLLPDFTITHVEPAPVPLPSVPGLYVARININALTACTIWRLNDQGWETVAGGGSLGPEHSNKNLGGLVRLVPEA